MSLTEPLRAELAAIVPRAECDRLAQLSGLLHAAGSIHLRAGRELWVELDVADSATARAAFSLVRALGLTAEIRTYRRRAFDRATRYQLHVEGGARALQVLHEAGVLSRSLAPLEVPPRRVVARGCCRAAYVRGALLGAASLSGGRSPHLEIRTAGPDGAAFLAAVARDLGARLAVLERRGHSAAYSKGRETIAHLLAAVGAGDAVLGFEERAVLAETRARANRRANADHANLVRTSRAAHEHLRAVRALAAAGELGDLPERLQEAARLRAKHPTASLAQLAARAHPPATKAAMHRRLRALIRLARG